MHAGVAVTFYQTSPHVHRDKDVTKVWYRRHAWSAHRSFYTEQKTLQFPLLLLRMEMHANAAIQDLQSTVSTISAELQGKCLAIVQVLPHSQQTFCS